MSADSDFHAKLGPTPAESAPSSKLDRLVREWCEAADAWDHTPCPGDSTPEELEAYRLRFQRAGKALRDYARGL